MPTYTTIEEQIEHGLDGIDPSRTITVPLKDLLYVYRVLGELIRFFHQPAHYPTLDAVERFLGTVDGGAIHALHEAHYRKLRDVWPADIEAAFDEGMFQHPEHPYYYESLSEREHPDT